MYRARRARGERLEARLKVRRWQQACDADDPNENAGSRVDAPLEAVEQMPAAPEKLPRPAREKTVRRSVTDPDAHFLRSRGGRFALGYTAEIGVSNDHLIVAQRVTQEATDNASLEPMVELIEATCAERPDSVVADSGYYSNWNVERMEQRGIDAYVPDSNLARELNLGQKPTTSAPPTPDTNACEKRCEPNTSPTSIEDEKHSSNQSSESSKPNATSTAPACDPSKK